MNYEYIHRTRTTAVRLDMTMTRAPGRGQRWSAELGNDLHADGVSEKVAADTLAERLRAFVTHYQQPRVLTFRGYTAILSIGIGHGGDCLLSWVERVVDPDGRISHSGSAAESWDEAEAAARFDLVQRSTDWFDDASLHAGAAYLTAGGWRSRDGLSRYSTDELYRYAAWQRAARAAMDAGRDDWHEWATRNQGSFAVSNVVGSVR